MPGTKVVIIVGGPSRGTRFRPLSLEVPKPLFPIAGRPMIYHHIEACTAQVTDLIEIILLGFYKEVELEKFVKETEADLKVKIRYLNEKSVLGTAGGLFHYRDEIMTGSPAEVIVMHSDICCAFPLKEMLQFHRDHKKPCSIMATKVPKDHSLFYGCIVKDESSNCLLHYTEKPETYVSDLVNAGVYCFDPTFFDMMGQEMSARHTMPSPQDSRHPLQEENRDPRGMQLEQDIFAHMSGTGNVMVYHYHGFWRAIKNAGSSVYCNDLYTKHYAKSKPDALAHQASGGPTIVGHCIIHPSAKVDPSAKIGPNVTIGANVVIGKGVRVLNSIVLDGSHVQDHACVVYTILGWDSSVGQWARLEGIPNNTPFSRIHDKRQGVTILATGSSVTREVIVRNCIVMPHKALSHSYTDEILL